MCNFFKASLSLGGNFLGPNGVHFERLYCASKPVQLKKLVHDVKWLCKSWMGCVLIEWSHRYVGTAVSQCAVLRRCEKWETAISILIS